MNIPIAPLPPINALITIQPVGVPTTSRDVTGTQTLLALLSHSGTITGFVVNRDQKNNPIIRTPAGDFVVESDVFIKTGSEVVLKMDAAQANQARIISIDHQTPEEYSVHNLRTGIAEDTIAKPQFNAPGVTARTTQSLPLLQALVLQALTSAPNPALPRALLQLPAGTPLNLTVHDVHLPPMPVSVSTVSQPASVANLLPPQGQAPQNVPNSVAAPLAAAFFAFDKVQNTPQPMVAPQLNAPAAPTTLQTPGNVQAFTGNVIGHGEDGSNIVHTPFASLKIFTAQPLPSGTTLTLTAEVTDAQTPMIPVAMPNIPTTAATAAPNFQYLTTALTQLMTSDPALARQLMQQLPVIGPRFTSGLLFFLAAVKSGERRNMLNHMELGRLDAMAPNLLTQLSKDIRELNQSFTNPPFDEWKPVHLPLVFGSQVETAKLYIRKEPDESGAKVEKTGGSNRFLLDLNLSELGQMQLDGFVRTGERGKSLELFLRSAQPLDGAISQEIRNLFTTSTEATGIAGNIVFQQGAEHFVKPLPKPPAPPPGSTKHTILA